MYFLNVQALLVQAQMQLTMRGLYGTKQIEYLMVYILFNHPLKNSPTFSILIIDRLDFFVCELPDEDGREPANRTLRPCWPDIMHKFMDQCRDNIRSLVDGDVIAILLAMHEVRLLMRGINKISLGDRDIPQGCKHIDKQGVAFTLRHTNAYVHC